MFKNSGGCRITQNRTGHNKDINFANWISGFAGSVHFLPTRIDPGQLPNLGVKQFLLTFKGISSVKNIFTIRPLYLPDANSLPFTLSEQEPYSPPFGGLLIVYGSKPQL